MTDEHRSAGGHVDAPDEGNGSASWSSRARHRVLDGRYAWGSLDVGASRQGFRHYRLVVFPPGVTASERRRIRLARSWPTWGAVAFTACLSILCTALGPWTGLMASTALWLSSGILVRLRAGDVATRVRTLSVVLMDRHHDPRSAERIALMADVAERLTHADRLLQEQKISAACHELAWGLAYDLLALGQSAHPSTHG
ncbi:DUF6611 family protein [Mycolicibacterium madagascariense]|uniref:DUF6611 family protein n=1 Tax=Mycolicibacterium madagascariense TaxID=212765 RepID=UPI0013D7F9F5|nr:DUF6611 family protein [Mycolicibacterium madagascariense]MCV7012472.1 hypothetical protein [Mycolicibacterium madagascariense]